MLPKRRISTHPGEILRTEFLDPLGISQSVLARHIGVSPHVVCELVHGRRNLSPRMALMLSQALGASVEFWTGLQTDYDVTKLMQTKEGERLATITSLAPPA